MTNTKYELIDEKPVGLLCQHHIPARVKATRLVKCLDTTLTGRAFSVQVPLCDQHASDFVSLDDNKSEDKKRVTSHSDCDHEATKSARAKCRRERKI